MTALIGTGLAREGWARDGPHLAVCSGIGPAMLHVDAGHARALARSLPAESAEGNEGSCSDGSRSGE
eukprot:9483944-Pyramimonas_sp.AAC.1